MRLSLSRLLRPYRMSQAEEHETIHRFFAGTSKGFFVDVGAHNGRYTQWFEERGWDGILVEPLPDLAEQLRHRRRAAVVECLVGSPEEAGSTLPFYRDRSVDLSTLHPEQSLHGRTMDVIARPVRTLDSILEEYQAPRGFDFLKVDVEFHELPVMQGFDFARWAPRLIVIEDHAYDLRLHRHITARGYRYFQRVNLNAWYVPNASPHRTTPLMRYAYFRKYYGGLPARVAKRAVARLARKP